MPSLDQAENPKRLAVYARVSSEEQRDGQTIDSQVAELERFAREREWPIVGIYKDEGYSGAILSRPELDHLRDDAAQGKFGAVLLNDVDRLARDVAHLAVIKRDLERHGVQVIFRKLPAEASPTANLMVNILGSFAEFERELIADRVRRGRQYKVQVRRQFLGCLPPFGYRYVPKDPISGRPGVLEVAPDEASVVRQMFAWVADEGLSARRVLARLNERKMPTRKGSTWAKSSVLRILHSEVYTGLWHYNKFQGVEPTGASQRRGRYRRHVKSALRRRPRSEWIPLELPTDLRLVSREEWERVQTQLQRNLAFSPRNGKHLYVLRGLVRCGGCFGPYIGEPGHGHFYYRCSNRCKRVPTVSDTKLNETVWREIQDVMLQPDIIADGLVRQQTAVQAQVTKDAREAQEIAEALRQMDGEEARLLDVYRRSIIDADQLGGELAKIKSRRETLRDRDAQINRPTSGLSENDIRRSIRDYCEQASASMRSFTNEQRQRFLQLLHIECIFDGNSIRIRGRLPIGRSGPRLGRTDSNPSSPGVIAGKALEHYARNPSDLGGIEGTAINDYVRNPHIAVEFERVAELPPTELMRGVTAKGEFCSIDDPYCVEVRRLAHSKTPRGSA